MKITKRSLINLIKKRNNPVADITLKKLRDKNFKIKMFKDMYPSKRNTRQRTKYYRNIGYAYDENTIVFNEEYPYTKNQMEETCVHETNHAINYKLWGKISFVYLEFLANVAEHMYRQNYTFLTRNRMNKIKKNMLRTYVNYRKYVNDKTFREIQNYSIGTIY